MFFPTITSYGTELWNAEELLNSYFTKFSVVIPTLLLGMASSRQLRNGFFDVSSASRTLPFPFHCSISKVNTFSFFLSSGLTHTSLRFYELPFSKFMWRTKISRNQPFLLPIMPANCYSLQQPEVGQKTDVRCRFCNMVFLLEVRK